MTLSLRVLTLNLHLNLTHKNQKRNMVYLTKVIMFKCYNGGTNAW